MSINGVSYVLCMVGIMQLAAWNQKPWPNASLSILQITLNQLRSAQCQTLDVAASKYLCQEAAKSSN